MAAAQGLVTAGKRTDAAVIGHIESIERGHEPNALRRFFTTERFTEAPEGLWLIDWPGRIQTGARGPSEAGLVDQAGNKHLLDDESEITTRQAKFLAKEQGGVNIEFDLTSLGQEPDAIARTAWIELRPKWTVSDEIYPEHAADEYDDPGSHHATYESENVGGTVASTDPSRLGLD